MQTKTYNVYKWDELSEEAKEKALERYRYINVEGSFWYDYEGKTGFTAKELQRMKVKVQDAPTELINHKKIYFDVDRAGYIQFVDAEFSNEYIARKFLRVPSTLWYNVEWNIIDCPHREGNTRLEYYDYNTFTGKEFTPKQKMILDRACEIFSDKIHEALVNLRNDYEYQMSDEAIIDTLTINEYDFTEDGHID